jgi:hypothetical protein
MLGKFSVALGALFLSAGAANAWSASVDGPDVFGNIKVIATEGSGRDAIVVQCDSKEELYVAFIKRKKEFEEIPELPASLLIQVNSGEPLRLSATLRSWNDNYMGFVATGREPALVQAINAIKGASGRINVGAEVSGNQVSATFGSRGSTSAMNKVIASCKLNAIQPPA